MLCGDFARCLLTSMDCGDYTRSRSAVDNLTFRASFCWREVARLFPGELLGPTPRLGGLRSVPDPVVGVGEELVRFGRRRLYFGGRPQVREGLGRLPLQGEYASDQQVGAKMTRLDRQRRLQLHDRLGDAIDARVHGGQRITRIRPFG